MNTKIFANVNSILPNVKSITEICTMQILIISATEMEIAATRTERDGLQYLITGVGSPACSYHLQEALKNNSYDLVIQAGIGGSFDNKLEMSTVHVIKKDVFADLAIYENGILKTLFDVGFAEPNQQPYTNGWLVNESAILSQISLPLANAITVNMVTDKMETIEMYRQSFHPMIESMEGAAFHYVCLQKQIPFLQIRSISNVVGERDKSKWKIKESIRSLNETLIQIVDALK